LWRTVAPGALRVRIAFAAAPEGAIDLRRRRWRELGALGLSLLAKHVALVECEAAPRAPRAPDCGDLARPVARPLPTNLASSLELPGGSRAELLAHLREVLLAERCSLSPREAGVCAGIILGYTTLGISLNFGISLSTVATHRKRAYRKLGICSQNELFSRYFETVNQKLAANASLVRHAATRAAVPC